MTDPTLLDRVLTHDETLAEAAPPALREAAASNPAHAPEAIDALITLLETPREVLYDESSNETELMDGAKEIIEIPDWLDETGGSAVPALAGESKISSNIDHREASMWALGALAPRYPEAVAASYDQVLALLDSERASTREYALYAAGRIAATTPADADRCVQAALGPALEADSAVEQGLAACGLTGIAMSDPSVVLSVAPALQDLLVASQPALRGNAAEALCMVATESPNQTVTGDPQPPFDVGTGDHAAACAQAIAHVAPTFTGDPANSAIHEAEGIEDVLTGHGIVEPLTEALAGVSDDPWNTAVALVYIGSYSEPPARGAAMASLADLGSGASDLARFTRRLVETVPFNVEWAGSVPDVDPASRSVELDVRPGNTDGNWNEVTIGPLGDGVRIRDYNRIDGTTTVRLEAPAGTTLARADSSRDVHGIEVDPLLMKSLGVSESDSVTVEPVRPSLAMSVTVKRPTDVAFDYDDAFDSAFDGVLTDHPVAPGDIVPVPVTLDGEPNDDSPTFETTWSLPVEVVSTVPNKPVLVTDSTIINVEAGDIDCVGDWWGTQSTYSDSRVRVNATDDINSK